MSNGTVIAKSNAKENKLVKFMQGDEVIATYRKVRTVELSTEISITVEDSCPDADLVEYDPTRIDGTGVIYDSKVQWDPVTHKCVKTNVVRTTCGSWATESSE